MRSFTRIYAISAFIGLASAMWEVQEGVFYDPIGGTTFDQIHTLHPNGEVTVSNKTTSVAKVASDLGLFVPADALKASSSESWGAAQAIFLPDKDREAFNEFHERQLVGPSVDITGSKSSFTVIYDSSNPTPDVAKPAIEAAVKVWADNFPSSVKVRILSKWTNLSSGTLGSASSPYSVQGSLCGTPQLQDNSVYTSAAAASLAGVDFIPDGQAHIYMQFNAGSTWSYDPTLNTIPFTTWDLMSVVLHEICHALFFTGRFGQDLIYASDNLFTPGRYDRFLVPATTASISDKCTSKTALASIMVNSMRFVDPSTSGTNFLVFSPNPYEEGSSTYHFDTNQLSADCVNLGIAPADCSQLMTPSLPNSVLKRSPGSTTLRVMNAILGASAGFGGKCDANPFEYFVIA